MIRMLGDHVWQSTLVAVIAALVALALRRNHARLRYAIWLAASIKFLIPFAMLIAAGRQLGWLHAQSAEVAAPAVAAGLSILIDAGQPFTRLQSDGIVAAASSASPIAVPWSGIAMAVWLAGTVGMLLLWWLRWRRVAAILHRSTPIMSGREIDALRRVERRFGLPRSVDIVAADSPFEPGVFGVLRPILLWPRALTGQLAEGHIEAILEHELSHVARRDNLAAALHGFVQAAFWFHPAVWWIGKRLIDERERACD
jgi:bla regulator protein blaR1